MWVRGNYFSDKMAHLPFFRTASEKRGVVEGVSWISGIDLAEHGKPSGVHAARERGASVLPAGKERVVVQAVRAIGVAALSACDMGAVVAVARSVREQRAAVRPV